jgi:hypothetical protein
MEKCMFLVYSRVILGYVILKAGKLVDKKNLHNQEYAHTKTPKDIHVFNGMV